MKQKYIYTGKKRKGWQTRRGENWRKGNIEERQTNTAGWVFFFYSLIPKKCKQGNVKAAMLFECIMAAAVGRSQVLTCSKRTQPHWSNMAHTPPAANSVTKLAYDTQSCINSSR